MSSESIVLSLVHEGKPLVINGLTKKEGLLILNETSAWPRRTNLHVKAESVGTREKLKNRDGIPNFSVRRHGINTLKIFGHRRGNLPEGRYSVTIRIYGMRSAKGTVEVPKNGVGRLTLSLRKSERNIHTRPKAQWDREIRRILDASELDQMPATDWVANPGRRARRRACLFNILAVCGGLKMIPHVKRLFFAEVDRIYAEVDSEFFKLLKKPQDERRFASDGPPGHGIHKRLLERIPESDAENYRLESFRQRGNPSMQIVTAMPPGAGRRLYVEADIDKGDIRNPLGLIIHALEVAHPGRTNHVALRRKLLRTAASAFLAYTL